MKKLGLLLLGGMLLFSGCATIEAEPSESTIQFTVLKIGKADAILAIYGDHGVLIDAGEEEDGDEIVEYLQDKGVKELDAVIITHTDKDHVGGILTVLEAIAVKKTIEGPYQSENKLYSKARDYADEHGIEWVQMTGITTEPFGDMEFTFYPPMKEYKGDNDNSLIISVRHGDCLLLFAGDAEASRLAEFMQQNNAIHQFLKVPHHGVFEDNSSLFFDTVQMQYAAITDSDKNPAEQKTLEALRQAGARVFQTKNGNVYAQSDGKTLKVYQ